jgi:hypothetical protein
MAPDLSICFGVSRDEAAGVHDGWSLHTMRREK